MIILDKPRKFDSTTIKIPLYHRGHLSLFEGAKVWVCFLPGIQSGQFSELIISPIHSDSWTDLWRITITLQERVGLVHDVFKILANRHINIITAESASRERQRLHSIEIVFNAKEYISYNDRTHEERSSGKLQELVDLRREILARLIDDIAFLPTGQPRLKIRRVGHLLNARRNFNDASLESYNVKPLIKDTLVTKTDNGEVVIKLPTEIRNSLEDEFGPPSDSGTRGKYLMVSDTTDRFLRIYFMKENDSIVAPTIEHKDEIGALSAITEALHNSNFNILTSLSRLYQWGSQARTEFVLQPPEELKGKSRQIIEKNLEEALATPVLVDDYGVKIGYPKSYVSPPKTSRLTVAPNTEADSLVSKVAEIGESKNISIESVIGNRYRAINQRILKDKPHEFDFMRKSLLESLDVEQKAIPRSIQNGLKNSLFISYNFEDEDLFNIVKKEARKYFDVYRGKDIAEASTNRSGIIEIISPCTHFLGLWTHSGGYKYEDKFIPTPWMHWELGVANTLGMRCRLLISGDIHPDAWTRLAGETPHIMFDRLNFQREARKAVQSLSSSASG